MYNNNSIIIQFNNNSIIFHYLLLITLYFEPMYFIDHIT